MTAQGLRDAITKALEDMKGRDLVALEVRQLTDLMDFMLIATGGSNRHVKALVDQVIETAKAAGVMPLGVEGRDNHEWVLVDLGPVVVHIMQAATREFYGLERLWTPIPVDSSLAIPEGEAASGDQG